MIDGLDAIGEAVADVVAGAGQAVVAAAEILQHAVWVGSSAPEHQDADKPRADTEKGPQDDSRAG